MTIKDSHWLAGVTSAVGSRALADFVPGETSAAVERLEAAGAVIYAKTTTPEFCYFGITESPLNGRTNNPWNLSRTPGGSSGGAAAALAAGAGPLALGGDGGGRSGSRPRSAGSSGSSRRSARRARALLAGLEVAGQLRADGALGGGRAGDAAGDRRHARARPPQPRRERPGRARAGPARAADRGLRGPRLRAGRRRRAAQLPGHGRPASRRPERRCRGLAGLGSSVQTWSAIAVADARHADAAPYEHHRELVGADALRVHGLRRARDDRPVRAARRCGASSIHRAYAELFARTGASVLLTRPSAARPSRTAPPTRARSAASPIDPPWLDWCGFLYDANLAGLPACAVPVGLGDDRLPVSVQLLGMRGHDGAVLAAAEAVERLAGFDAAPPAPRPVRPDPTRRSA